MAGTICNSAKPYFGELGRLLERIDQSAISRFADLAFDAWKNRKRVYIFGNGGSAFTSSHMVCDFVKTAEVPGQRRLQAFSMVDNLGMLTAVGNDISYEDTLRYPLSSYAQRGDVAVAISCSGNSPNVLRACEWAKENGLAVVALTGLSGGKVSKLADVHINVPSDNYGVVEDLHMSIGHIVAQTLKSRVAAEK